MHTSLCLSCSANIEYVISSKSLRLLTLEAKNSIIVMTKSRVDDGAKKSFIRNLLCCLAMIGILVKV